MSNPGFILSLSSAALIPDLASDFDAAPAPSMSQLMYLDHAFDLRAVSGADANTIALKKFQFAPASLTVTVGTTPSRENLDSEPHTVVSSDRLFRLDRLDQSGTFTFTFDKPGARRFLCSIHPQMMGTTIVK